MIDPKILNKHFDRCAFLENMVNSLSNDLELNQYVIFALSGATVQYMDMDAFKENVLQRFRIEFWQAEMSNLDIDFDNVTQHFFLMPVRTKDDVEFYSNEAYPIFVGRLDDKLHVITTNYLTRTFSTYCLSLDSGKILSRHTNLKTIKSASHKLYHGTEIHLPKCS